MSTVEEIRAAIEKLPTRERGRLRRWFLAKDSRDWDKQFERDAESGKLDNLAAGALGELKKGKTREL